MKRKHLWIEECVVVVCFIGMFAALGNGDFTMAVAAAALGRTFVRDVQP